MKKAAAMHIKPWKNYLKRKKTLKTSVIGALFRRNKVTVNINDTIEKLTSNAALKTS